MRRIKLIVALAAALVVLMMAAAPAMADINLGNHNFGNDGDHNISFGNFGGLFILDANRGLGTGGDIDIDGVNGLGFNSLSFDNFDID
jgi:hypothetical protein